MKLFRPIIQLPAILLVVTFCAQAQEVHNYEITVSAGGFDRLNTPVSFALPDEIPEGFYTLSGNGSTVDLQVDGNNIASFILDELSAGSTAIFTLETIPSAASHTVTAETVGEALSLQVDDEHVLSYFFQNSPLPDGVDPVFERGGYIHPVRTPQGVVVTGDFPPDHIHHHGIWAAWTNTEFQGRTPDFWNMGQERGTVEVLDLDETWQGPVQAGFRARHRYVDLEADEPVTAVNEEWIVRVYNVPAAPDPYRIFDLKVTQSVNTDNPLHLPEYRYGGVGFRGHDDWDGAENTFFLTSEGYTREDGHATRARWCHIGGYVGDHLAGISILGHPDNYRHPQPMRIHPTEPFFNYAPVQLGDMTIEPGSPYTATYRYVTYDGEPDVEQIERLWHDFAYPPGVTVKRAE